jgi:16S rRNA (uracil1498-N3)-methyltransferase
VGRTYHLEMTRRRFFASPEAFDFAGERVTLTAEEARHLRDVLRLKEGDEVYVFNGTGREFCCVITLIKRDVAELSIRNEVEPTRPESPLNLTLAVALLKGEKFDLVVQKITELGACEVVPVITRFADIRLRDESDANKRIARWQRIAIEAAKQSGRTVVPRVSTPVLLESLLTNPANSESLRLMFSERGGESFAEVPQTLSDNGTITALVGSEGGWSDEEIQEARTAGWHLVTLGGRTLRAETAAITVAGLLQHRYGDLN